MEFDELSRSVIGYAIEVHRTLGPGLLARLSINEQTRLKQRRPTLLLSSLEVYDRQQDGAIGRSNGGKTPRICFMSSSYAVAPVISKSSVPPE